MIRTGYSFRTAVGHLPEVASRLKEVDWDTFPITDRLSTFAYVRATKVAQANGLRPIYGVELPVCPALGEKKPTLDWWTFLAKDNLRPLHDLIAKATRLRDYKHPLLLYKEAATAPGVIKISGSAALLSELPKEPQEDLYFGLSPATPRGLLKEAIKRGLPIVAMPNNFFPRQSDLEFYRVTLGRFANTQTYPMWITSDDEWRASRPGEDAALLKVALELRQEVLARSTATLRRAKLLSPDKPKTLRQLCEDGAARLNVNLDDPVYSMRLSKELSLIKEKEFEDYFFIVADLMQFARSRMVVGPARGSSCGSLACYLLGITSIDPIPYDLVFERFIDVTRTDLPDIDVDFSDVNRHLVFEYAAKKYGADHVARLGSVNQLMVKSAFKQIGAALKIPGFRITEITNTIIKRSAGDARASSTIEDALKETDVGRKFIADFPEAAIVSRMEAHPSVAGQHAAGLILTDTPVRDYVAVNHSIMNVTAKDAEDKEQVLGIGAAMCDKKDAEELNLLKIDALGLTQLSTFERCLKLMGEEQRSVFLEKLPLNDPAAFEVLNQKRFSGIFQFIPGAALTSLVERILDLGGRINALEDIVSLTALVRPGPLASGATDEWMLRRTDRSPVTYPHPALEPFLNKTLGMVVYQEQVLAIGREIGNLSWEEVTALRKAMSRSLGKEFFDKFGDKWKQGAREKGLSQETADKIWDELCEYGSWAFNRSHSVAYGVVSYWCCWLKAHFPLEFAAATLDGLADQYQQVETLRELRSEGISYVPVDPERSTAEWQVDRENKRLIGPLTNIIGIGPKKVMDILTIRMNGKGELAENVRKKLEGAKTNIDSLEPIATAIEGLAAELEKKNIVSKPTPIKNIALGRDNMIIAKVTKISPGDDNEPTRVAQRGGRVYSGPTSMINFYVRDDTGEILCKIGRKVYSALGKKFLENATAGKSLFAIKGWVPKDFRMIHVQNIRHVGEHEG